MLEEKSEKQIIEEGTTKIRSAINLCANQIISCFQNSILSLSEIHRNKESQKDRIINQQKDTISDLKRFMDFMNFMEDFAQQYEKFRKPSEIRNDSSVIPSFSQQKSLFFEQRKFQNESKHPLRAPTLENEKIELDNGKQSLENKGIKRIKDQIIEKKELKSIRKRGERKRNMKKDEVKMQQKKRRIVRAKKAGKEKKSQQKQKDKPVVSSEYKSPLQCRSTHQLCEVSYTPNVTQLKYVQYQHTRPTVFDDLEINILKKCDLSGVTSFALTSRQVNNEALTNFTRLELNNLRSLRIESNLITDIRPLRNLDLKNIEDLDVSFNPLNIESAYFLAIENFQSLIYFTVSFDTGLDDECWKILLSNGMNNYPKLQALDVCNSNQLHFQTKKAIITCMAQKSLLQKRKSGTEGFPRYPESYQIKVSWNESKQIFDTYTEDKIREIGQIWQLYVKYDRIKLPRLHARAFRLAAGLKCRGKKGKRKIIRKPQKLQSQTRKKHLEKQKEERDAESESQNESEQEDLSVKSVESENQNQSESDESEQN